MARATGGGLRARSGGILYEKSVTRGKRGDQKMGKDKTHMSAQMWTPVGQQREPPSGGDWKTDGQSAVLLDTPDITP